MSIADDFLPQITNFLIISGRKIDPIAKNLSLDVSYWPRNPGLEFQDFSAFLVEHNYVPSETGDPAIPRRDQGSQEAETLPPLVFLNFLN